MIDRMKKLAKEKDICVLATVSGEKPHCSLMAYTTDDECSEIYMATHRATGKFKVFLADPDAEVICIKIRSFLLLDGLTDAHFEEVPNEPGA
jgi:general stress protein 26